MSQFPQNRNTPPSRTMLAGTVINNSPALARITPPLSPPPRFHRPDRPVRPATTLGGRGLPSHSSSPTLVRCDCPMFTEKRSFSLDTKPRLTPRHDSVPKLDVAEESSTAESAPKRVRFDVDEDDKEKPKTTRYEYPRVPADLVPALFWTRKECKEILREQSRLAKECVRHSPEIIDSIYFLHGYSTAVSTKKQVFMSTERAQQILADSDCRGLERFMTSLMSSHRLWSMEQLLSIQHRWRDETDDEASSCSDSSTSSCKDLDLMLYVWSLKLSSAPTHYATQIAAGDAREAAVINDVAEDGSSSGSNHSGDFASAGTAQRKRAAHAA